MMRFATICAASFILIAPATRNVHGQLTAERVRKALNRGIDYVRQGQSADGSWGGGRQYAGGVAAMATLAMLESGVPMEDPAVQRALNFLRQNVNERRVYSVSLKIMLFTRSKEERDRRFVQAMVKWLQSAQVRDGKARGGWGYTETGGYADNSNSQFAMLALYEAEQAGYDVSEDVMTSALEYWLTGQNADGSWGYGVGGSGKGSMTCAGLASVMIAVDSLQQRGATVSKGKCTCRPQDDTDAVRRGLKWLGNHFSVVRNPFGSQVLYYLYALERVGRISARRFFITDLPEARQFQRHDWYREGAANLIKLQRADGSWSGSTGNSGTSMSLLFLSKGRRPILVSKLKRTGKDWQQLRRDLKHLTRHTSQRWQLPMSWQIIDSVAATADDYSQSPVLFLSGRKSFQFTPAQREELREYIEKGGFIFADRCGVQPGSVEPFAKGFGKSFRDEMLKMFPPGAKVQPLDAQHPVWSIEERVDPRFVDPAGRWLWGIEYACRMSVIYCPGNLSCYWELDTIKNREKFRKIVSEELSTCRAIGVNVLSYATGRKMKPKDAVAVEQPKEPVKVKSARRGHFAIAKLRHSGGCDAAPRAMFNLMEAVADSVQIHTSKDPPIITISGESLFDYHFVYVHGRHDFRLTGEERRQLKTFVQRGGIIVGDAICASPIFVTAFRREMREVFGQPLKAIASDHPMFGSEYGGDDLSNVLRRESIRNPATGKPESKERRGPPVLEGHLVANDRYGVIFSPLDLSCALESPAAKLCSGYPTEDAARIGINLILYSLHE